jgi:type II secretion system protein N
VTSGRGVAAAATALAVFAAALAATFPTDALVRALLARTPLPGPVTVAFGRATLRPAGLTLADVVLSRADGAPLARLDAVTVRPSLRGLLRDGTGRPWALRVAACGGRGRGRVEADGAGSTLALAWHDVDLARCPALPGVADAVAGRAQGSARFALAGSAGTVGVGRMRIRDAAWRTGSPLPGLATLHADPAEIEWSLAAGRLLLDRIELHGPEVRASGSGALVLAEALAESALDVSLAVSPGPAATRFVRDLIGGLPPADDVPGAGLLAVGGTIAAPRLVD